MIRTRFAPSPTGYLHLGHAYAAKVAFDLAKRHSGDFLLRFEDIDHTRVRPHYYDACRDDLRFLGLLPAGELPAQLERTPAYRRALEELESRHLIYPCFCTRREIEAELAQLTSAPHGPDGALYPGTCKGLSEAQRNERLASGATPAWRLDCEKAAELVGAAHFDDFIHGSFHVDPLLHGDVILARKDIGTSYHLAVTLDDARDEITHVTRGEDLLQATHIHRTLQVLLDLPAPAYLHHPLVLGPDGKRLAKRDQPRSIQELRAQGMTAPEVLQMLPASPLG
ncbi:tRNA glutamyl-Q(34) synthetase GluQRS [Haloferula rosea]|uniref:tRNA glutamyl-Q(34) synthetase GluQRS n=1 Tax=Haloferula rosea TaxID=490093 RepID=UPI002D80A9FE|nr:tRNA glutamyl-Q(34) synthetase GluQRS [Haloferula rosea]